ncbi:MAG: 2-oxo acid dehydrogenase subunit E2 [Anaerolineales bacterium]|nr:2-oxo acid dehydrogenase subunit E2 [Anaerolineales bacterium]
MSSPTVHRNLPVRETRALGRVRRIMAQTMRDSVDRAALSQVTRDMDLTAVQAARQAAGEQRVSLNVYVLAGVARTLRAHSWLNAELVEQSVVIFDVINLGVAVAVPDGLVVAVIRDADQKSLTELAAAVADLAQRARTGKLGMADIDGGTFTVSNLGMFGIDGGFPLPRPPEGAILLVGRVRTEPALVNGALAERQRAWFSLTFDHRFIDGATAAAFLQDLQEWLLDEGRWNTP